MGRRLFQSIRSAPHRISAFVCWVLRPDTMEDDSADSIRNHDNPVSFLRWLLSPESLQRDEAIDQSEIPPAFVSWLVASEQLEPISPDCNRNDSQPTCENE